MRTVYEDRKGRRWDRDSIIKLLDDSDVALERALLLVYDRQERDEKASRTTSKLNAVGFSGGGEAEFLSSLAEHARSAAGRWPEGQRLSPRQKEALRSRDARGVPKMGKYWAQILEEIARRDGA